MTNLSTMAEIGIGSFRLNRRAGLVYIRHFINEGIQQLRQINYKSEHTMLTTQDRPNSGANQALLL